MSVGKASIKRAARAGTAKKEVKASVVSPMDTEEIQAKFLSKEALKQGTANRPVRLTEDMPVHLL